jgi:CelD/BcsL family acetyltransferase involved in cellulose biosynthesis
MSIEEAERPGDEKVSVRVISDLNSIFQMERVWNTLVERSSQNPFLLNGFIAKFIESNHSNGWAPLVLVISADNGIIGIAPLMTKKKFGVRTVRFLHSSSYSPDFIFYDQYRETCIAHTLDFLFKTLRCTFADFPFPGDSPNLRVLRQQSKPNRIHFCTLPIMGHCILPKKCTWTEFERLKGNNFVRQLKKIERKLDRAGSWRIVCVDGNEESDAVRKILYVERMSWKEAWRAERGDKIDEELLAILNGAQHTARIEPNFKWNVWFLELNNQTLAYNLVLQYKKVAFMTKMSYDDRYRRFYPGVYLANFVIRELFKKEQVKSIDFLTDLPFLRNWTSISLNRIRVMLAKGVVPTIVRSRLVNEYLMKSQHILFDPLRFHLAA